MADEVERQDTPKERKEGAEPRREVGPARPEAGRRNTPKERKEGAEPRREVGPARPEAGRRAALVESLVMFGIATAVCAGLWQLARVVSFVDRNLQAFIAAVFLYLPTGLLVRRREDFADYGLTHRPVKRGVLLFLLCSAVVFPLFAVGFYAYYHVVCAASARGMALPRQLHALCRRWTGRPRLRVAPDFWEVVLAQLLVVALPEEYFFRGYLQSRLEVVWPSRRRVFGASVGYALLLASVLFALGHVLVDFNGLRLAVFFPALVFGWMRQYSGSILASVLFHAACNLVSELLHKSFSLT
jgi:membrane protease YdiL (CAAX protease family)